MDSTMIAGIIAGVMGLIGSAIGGILSFIGNRQGAKIGIMLALKREEEIAIKEIINLLKYTRSAVKSAEGLKKYYKDKKDVEIKKIAINIYDPDWPSKINRAKFTNNEREKILKWFLDLNLVIEDGNADIDIIITTGKLYLLQIDEIINKYDIN